MRQAQATSRRGSSADDINSWMARRWADIERRDTSMLGGERELSSRTLGTRQPTVQAASTNEEAQVRPPEAISSTDAVEPDASAPQPMDLGMRFRAARAGDSISRLVGSSDPGAIGKFLSLNGMDGRNSTLREGRNYVVPTRWDDATAREAAIGQALLGADNATLRALADAREAEAREAAQAAGSRNLTPVELMTEWAQPRAGVVPMRRRAWYDESPVARGIAREGGRALGLAPGVVRGGFNTVKGAVEGAYFISRLADPLERFRIPPGEAAADQLLDAGLRAGSYVKRGIEDPSIVRDDVIAGLRDFRRKQDLSATPDTGTFAGEFWRGADVGMNNGELLFDAGSTLLGGQFVRGAAGIGRLAKAPTPKELAFRAANPDFDARLDQAYKGMSHHIVGRNEEMPTLLGGGLYPRWFVESEFNKIRHEGMTTRDVFRNHIGVDEDYYGGKAAGTRWSGERDLGWTRYGPFERLYYGTSPYTQAMAGPILLGGTTVDAGREGAGQ